MVMIMISSPPITKLQTLSISLGIIQVPYDKKQKKKKKNDQRFSFGPIKCIYDQIQFFFDSLLSKYQCGFRAGYKAQHC